MATVKTTRTQPRIIGLTGGIATGKTTVSDYLASHYQLPVYDADSFARDAVAPGTPTLEAIATRFGPDILLPDGTLDRRALGAIIFADPVERQWLEAQIHPQVRARFADAIAHCDCNTLVLAIPLLFEAQLEDLVTEIWVVVCPPEIQLARLICRDRLAADRARARIAAQMPLVEKTARADCVLDNSRTVEDLLHQVDMKMRSH
ncbi:MAG: dephospho-CoA kinase [Cyanobacteria bacterium J06641_5]